MTGMTAPTPDQSARLRHDGAGGEIFAILARNLALTTVTLGIYRFWAKTRIRRYLWNHMSFEGDALEYTGTGRELFLGFVIVALVLALASGAYRVIDVIVLATFPVLALLLNVVLVAGFFLLTGVALYRARRYRLSRTLWRGIRGAQTGSAVLYGLKYLGYWALNVLSAGWTYPWMRMRLMHQMMNNTWFGDRRFHFDSRSGPLYDRFAAVWAVVFLALVVSASTAYVAISTTGFEVTELETIPPSLILIMLLPVLFTILSIILGITWYKAREYAYIASSARYEGLTFRLDTTFGSFLWLVVGNYLIRALSLGLGAPFAQMRTFRYVSDRLSISGEADFEAIRQSSEARPGLGEGLEAAFDLGDF